MCATAVAEMTFSGDRTGGAKPEANLNCPVRFQHAALSHCLLYCGSPLLYFCALILYAFPWGIL